MSRISSVNAIKKKSPKAGHLQPTLQKRPPLSPVQEEVLTMIVVGHRLTRAGLGIPPSQREIMEWMGWKSLNNVRMALAALERKGYIRRPEFGRHGKTGLARSIEVIKLNNGEFSR